MSIFGIHILLDFRISLVYYVGVIVKTHLILRRRGVYEMPKGGSKKMKIKAKIETGEVVEVLHENDDAAEEVTQEDIEQIYQSGGFRYVALILHAHASPG